MIVKSSCQIAFGFAVALLFLNVAAKCEDCSTEKVNHDCVLTIDRLNLLQPPTLQMYPGKVVRVRIKNALPFEQASLDWQSSVGSIMPDQASAILTALSSALQKVVTNVATPGSLAQPGPRLPPQNTSVDNCPATIATTTDPTAVNACVNQMMADATLAVADIGPLVNDDTVVYDPGKEQPRPRSLADFDDVRARILCRVLGTSVDGTQLGGVTTIQCASSDNYHDLVAEQDTLNALVAAASPSSAIAKSNVPALVTYSNSLISALEGVAQNLLQVATENRSDGDLGTIVDPVRTKNPSTPSCNSSLSGDSGSFGQSYGFLLQRQVSCSVNVFNLVANSIAFIPTSQQKRTIVTITVNYTDTRIETSTGIMVSALPSRSFTVSPVYSGTPPSVSNIVVKESDTWPLIIPYAAVHVRLGDDWVYKSHRRGAIYAIVLAGVNPNTVTADFGAGLSVAWRSLVLSPVAHFAHDVRLSSGFTNGESLGASFTGSVPTQQFWTTSFGLGIGIRVPLIPGR